MKKQFLLFGSLLLILFTACKKDTFSASQQATIDDDKIKAYMAANHLNMIKDASGLYYQIITADTGAHPVIGDTVQVTYTGKLLNGVVFDTEVASNFPLDTTVIQGWRIALPLIAAKSTAGGPYSRIRFLVPSALGYANVAQTGGIATIPANSVLDFTIDLIGFYPYPGTPN